MMLVRASSGVLPNNMTSRTTAGAAYVRMSENSSARTRVTLFDSADTINGNRSVMPPGWMPVPCNVTCASRQAAVRPSTWSGAGYHQPTGVTMFLPDRSSCSTTSLSASIGAYTTQSASSASTSATSFVASTPTGSRPASTAASCPALLALCTQQPTSSSSGWSSTHSMAALPTPP